MIALMDADYLLTAFISKLRNYRELDSLQVLDDASSERFHCYRMDYITVDDDIESILVEIDVIKNKVSYGPWGSAALSTIKID